MIEHLATSPAACPTCDLPSHEQSALFTHAVSAPLKADLALTYGCNNACRHCYNEPGRKQSRAMSARQWREVLERLAHIGVPHVIFTGGEPTLFDGLTDLVCTADRLGLIAGMNTNGRRLAHGSFAGELKRAGLSHVQVTVQSHGAEVHDAMSGTQAFDETVAGIRRSLSAGLHTITNTTLTRRNCAGAVSLVDFLHTLGVRCCAFNAMIHAGRGRAHADTLPAAELAPLLVALRDRAAELGMRLLWYTPTRYCEFSPMELELGARRCNAGEYSICVEPDADVLPCQSYYQPAGNLLNDDWETIWQSSLFRRFRNRVHDPIGCGLPQECRDCPDLSVCGGGCPLETGSSQPGSCLRLYPEVRGGQPPYQESRSS
jgi:radical SAM protein with 4Fe4S-binding SPASM domain